MRPRHRGVSLVIYWASGKDFAALVMANPLQSEIPRYSKRSAIAGSVQRPIEAWKDALGGLR